MFKRCVNKGISAISVYAEDRIMEMRQISARQNLRKLYSFDKKANIL